MNAPHTMNFAEGHAEADAITNGEALARITCAITCMERATECMPICDRSHLLRSLTMLKRQEESLLADMYKLVPGWNKLIRDVTAAEFPEVSSDLTDGKLADAMDSDWNNVEQAPLDQQAETIAHAAAQHNGDGHY